MKSLIKEFDKFPTFMFIILVSYLSLVILSSSIIKNFNTTSAFVILNGIVFILNASSIILYFVFLRKITFSKKLIIAVITCTICATTTIFSSTFLENPLNVFDIFYVPIKFINLICMVLIPCSIKISKKGLATYMKLIVKLAVVACLYNLVINISQVKSVFTISNTYSVSFQSFFLNRNTYGQFLFVSIIANSFLHRNTSNRKYYISFALFTVNLLLTFSRGAIVSTLIFLFLYYEIWNFKKIKQNWLTLITMSVLTISVVINPAVINYIDTIIIRKGNGLTGRDIVWAKGIEMISNMNVVFGIGNYTAKDIIYQLYAHNEFHSFYIETLVSGGIVEVFIFILLFSFLFYRIRVIKINDKIVGSTFWASLISVLAYSVIESVSFFSIGYVDYLFLSFFISIPLMYSNTWIKQLLIE